MKKRILALVLAMGMTLGLAACGGDSSSAGSAGSGSGDASAADTSDFKVGAIYINSRSDTAGYTYAHHHGITTAMEELGLDPDTQLAIQDNVKEDYDAVSTAVDNLVGEGCDIIFGISFGYMQAMADKAEEWPDVIFSHATGYMSNETNFNNYFGRAYQARYLAGIAAGLKSLETGNNNIGYVAAYGRQYAETSSGYQRLRPGRAGRQPRRHRVCEGAGCLGRRGERVRLRQGADPVLRLRRHLPALRLRSAPDRRSGRRRVRLRL